MSASTGIWIHTFNFNELTFGIASEVQGSERHPWPLIEEWMATERWIRFEKAAKILESAVSVQGDAVEVLVEHLQSAKLKSRAVAGSPAVVDGIHAEPQRLPSDREFVPIDPRDWLSGKLAKSVPALHTPGKVQILIEVEVRGLQSILRAFGVGKHDAGSPIPKKRTIDKGKALEAFQKLRASKVGPFSEKEVWKAIKPYATRRMVRRLMDTLSADDRYKIGRKGMRKKIAEK